MKTKKSENQKLYVVFANYITDANNEHEMIGIFTNVDDARLAAKKKFDEIVAEEDCWEFEAAENIREYGDGEDGYSSSDIDLDDTELYDCYSIEDWNNGNSTSTQVYESEIVK